MKLGMKEPAKEAENQVFQYLGWCEDDDDSIDAPLHRSTPKDKKESNFTFASRRTSQLEQYFQSAFAMQNDQLGSIQNAYKGLVVAWRHEDEKDDGEKTLVAESKASINFEVESRLSLLSSQSTTVSEGCLDNCEIPEPVLDLFKELAKQLLRCQNEIASLKEENYKLKNEKGNEIIKRRVVELTAEMETWKEICNESRKEIESLKISLSNHKEQIMKLQDEKKQMIHKLTRLQINHGNLEKDEQLMAQHSHFSHNLNALKRLNDKQQQMINNLQQSLRNEGRLKSTKSKAFDLSTSSGRSTLRSSLNASNVSINLLAKKLTEPKNNSLLNPLQYDESLVKLSRCVISSNEMLRHIENNESTDANLDLKLK